MSDDQQPLLQVEDVTVRFGGVVANDHVDLTCREGQITALLGPNGAGKTTLFNVITGALAPTSGRVRFLGQDITNRPPPARARMGLGRTFQNLAVAHEMSVFDNVMIGASRFRSYGAVAAALGLPQVRRSDRQLAAITMAALRVMGLTGIARLQAGSLPYGHLRRLEIARALALGPRLLLLDEPAAGLDVAETEELTDALLAIRREWGVSILVVEHDLGMVRRVSDDAYVLDFGVLLAGGPTEVVLTTPAVIEAYLGTPAAAGVT